MKFHSRKDSLFIGIFIGISILMLYVVVLAFRESTSLTGQLIVVLTSALVPALFIWIYQSTYYEINEGMLHYHSGPLKGNVPISQINSIIRGKTLWVGIKPAMARKGLIINYEHFNEIYISPEQEALFLEMLMEQNPSIKIIEAGESTVY